MLPLTVGVRDGVVQLVSTLVGAVISGSVRGCFKPIWGATNAGAFRGVAWGRWGGPDDGEADGRSIEMHTMSEEKLLEASRTLAHLHTASADAHQAAVDAAADSAAADAAVDSFLQICAGCSMGVDRNQDWVPL